MSIKVAILKSIRTLIRRYQQRKLKKLEFLGELHKMVCELEREAYNEKIQDEQRQKQEIIPSWYEDKHD
jgi:hypothetical protein